MSGRLDLARRALFDGIGATGVVSGPVTLLALPTPGTQLQTMIVARVPGEAGAMAAAFVTGQQRVIPMPATQAMRDSRLADLLSISSLHIAAAVGGVVLLTLRLTDGRLAHSRKCVGDYLLSVWRKSIGADDGAVLWLGQTGLASCSADTCVCVVDVVKRSRRWRVLATTSAALIPRETMAPACAAADIVVPDRLLPIWCQRRWLKLDRAGLAKTGTVTVRLDATAVATARGAAGDSSWQTGRGQPGQTF